MSAFLLALIYRSWQLGQADTVEDDLADIAIRDRGAEAEDVMEDDAVTIDDTATTDFVGVDTAPIVVLHARDIPTIRDDAPTDRRRRRRHGSTATRPSAPPTEGGDR